MAAVTLTPAHRPGFPRGASGDAVGQGGWHRACRPVSGTTPHGRWEPAEAERGGPHAAPPHRTGRGERHRARRDADVGVRTIHAALDAGVTLVDTADAYALGAEDVGHNESLIARALASYGGDTSGVLVATKGGHTRPGGDAWGLDGSPEHLRAACEASLARLGVDAIGLYQFHRPDPQVPYAESIGALRELADAGKIRMAGISNADPEQIRQARQILGDHLVSVQNQFSPAYRDSEPELRLCAELGLAFLPWSPLGGIGRAGGLGDRFAAFARIAAQRGASPQQVCLAWQLALAPVVVPIPGASRPETIRDSAAAADLVLDEQEIAALNAAG